MDLLTDRWTPLRFHPQQSAFYYSTKRFNCAPCGRRSGKSEIAKRRLVRKMLSVNHKFANFALAAPVWHQAKRLFWEDIQRLLGKALITKKSETELKITLVNTATLYVIGLDKPERIEGIPVDGIVVDEFAHCRANSWEMTIRPLIDTEGCLGYVDIIGVPRGAAHYRKIWELAKKSPDWGAFFWTSAEIIPELAEAAKADMDIKSWKREYEASWETYGGKAYYCWDYNMSTEYEVLYSPNKELLIALDFNVCPGVAAVCQTDNTQLFMLDEIWIPDNSNTELIIKALKQFYGHHKGVFRFYGDASGGARRTSAVSGSDWDLVRHSMKQYFPNNTVCYDIASRNPSIRSRCNSFNAMLKNVKGITRFFINKHCVKTIADIEGTERDDAGNIIKQGGSTLTHLTDAIGYLIWQRWPVYDSNIITKTY